jgi:hypothetical protein
MAAPGGARPTVRSTARAAQLRGRRRGPRLRSEDSCGELPSCAAWGSWATERATAREAIAPCCLAWGAAMAAPGGARPTARSCGGEAGRRRGRRRGAVSSTLGGQASGGRRGAITAVGGRGRDRGVNHGRGGGDNRPETMTFDFLSCRDKYSVTSAKYNKSKIINYYRNHDRVCIGSALTSTALNCVQKGLAIVPGSIPFRSSVLSLSPGILHVLQIA